MGLMDCQTSGLYEYLKSVAAAITAAAIQETVGPTDCWTNELSDHNDKMGVGGTQ